MISEKREWTFTNTYDTANVKYDPKFGNAKLTYKPNFEPGKIQSLGAKMCYYKVRLGNGKSNVGFMKVDFLAEKYHEKHDVKQYNFSKFITGCISHHDAPDEHIKQKFDFKKIKFDVDANGDVDPIQHNPNTSNFVFDDQDAIIFDINKKNNDNN